jgi:hypothetical protein
MCASILKAINYYNKFDFSPAYDAATILHPRYKYYGNSAWAEKPEWLELNNSNFQALWAQYKSLLRLRTRTKVVSNRINDAIDSIFDAGGATYNNSEDEEYEQWKRCESRAEKGSKYANNPIKYWVELRDRYPDLRKLALDVLSIPASSCGCERMFSELGDLLEARRQGIQPQVLAAVQCVRRWRKDGFGGNDDVAAKSTLTDEQMDNLYGIDTWDDD